jgi:hypothetical protein
LFTEDENGPMGGGRGRADARGDGIRRPRLAAAPPHIVALAPIIDRDDLVRLCREELTGVDVRAGSWDVRSRWFEVAVSAPTRRGEQRRGGTIECRTVAAYIARDAPRHGM